MLKILLAFSELMRPEILSMGDDQALLKILELLERQDTFILAKRDGPMLHALLSHFGIIEPLKNRERLERLDAQLVCKVLIQWKLLILKTQQYNFQKRKRSGSEMIPTRNQTTIQLEFKEE
jgi:hypothetical protein